MPPVPFTHTVTSLADWGGPVNSGSGCLSCVTHCMRGQSRWFGRSNAAPYQNCTDPEPEEYLCQRVTTFTNSHNIPPDNETCYQFDSGATNWTRTETWNAAGEKTSDVYSGSCTSSSELVCNGVTLTDDFNATMNADGTWTGTRHYTRTDTNNPATNYDITVPYNFGCPGFGFGTTTVVDTYCTLEQTQEQADEEVDGAENSTDLWGATKEEQFPSMGCYGSLSFDIPSPSSPLYRHDQYGREVLRARLTVADEYFPGQQYSVSWDEVVRNLGYGIARSGSGRGTTSTTRTRTYALSDPMSAPDDALGSMAAGDASWDSLGYSVITVPRTPSGPGSSPTSGFRAASFVRRSRIRFAMRVPGDFDFRVRKIEVLNSDPTDYTTTLATLSTSGTLADDGTNSTIYTAFAPSDHLRSVYLFLDWVRDGYGKDVAGWLALGKVRDGWAGFRQFDHATLQAASAHYRVKTFTQTSTASSDYMPPTPAPGDVACLESLPWLDFSQTQIWTQTILPGGGESDWALTSASGSANGASWSGEIASLDPPAFSLSTSPSAASWTQSESNTPTTPTSTGASWTNWDRVIETTNPAYGGTIVSVTRRTSTTTAYTYPTDDDVQETSQIYVYAPAPGQSVQLANVHAAGIA
jgi:hypothetical protein